MSNTKEEKVIPPSPTTSSSSEDISKTEREIEGAGPTEQQLRALQLQNNATSYYDHELVWTSEEEAAVIKRVSRSL